jgi:hypothetical protein
MPRRWGLLSRGSALGALSVMLVGACTVSGVGVALPGVVPTSIRQPVTPRYLPAKMNATVERSESRRR